MVWIPELQEEEEPQPTLPQRRGAGESLDKWVAAKILGIKDPELLKAVQGDATVTAEDMWRLLRGGYSTDPATMRRNALLGEHAYTGIPAGYGGALAGNLVGRGVGGLIGRGLAGAASGAALGSIAPGIGNAIGAGVGFLGGAFLGRELANYLNPRMAGSSLAYEALGLGLPGTVLKRAFPAVKAGGKAARLTRIPGVGKVAAKAAQEMPSFGTPFRAVRKIGEQYGAAKAAKQAERQGWEEFQRKLLESEGMATAAAQAAGRGIPRSRAMVPVPPPTTPPPGFAMPEALPGLPPKPKLLPPAGGTAIPMGGPRLRPDDVEQLLRMNVTPTPGITAKGVQRGRELLQSPKARQMAFQDLINNDIPPTSTEIARMAPSSPHELTGVQFVTRRPKPNLGGQARRKNPLYKQEVKGMGYSQRLKRIIYEHLANPPSSVFPIPEAERTPLQKLAFEILRKNWRTGSEARGVIRSRPGTSPLAQLLNIHLMKKPYIKAVASALDLTGPTGRIRLTLLPEQYLKETLPHEAGHQVAIMSGLEPLAAQRVGRRFPVRPGQTSLPPQSQYSLRPDERLANIIAKAIRRGEDDPGMNVFGPDLAPILQRIVRTVREAAMSGKPTVLPTLLATYFGADMARNIMKGMNEKNVASASTGSRPRK